LLSARLVIIICVVSDGSVSGSVGHALRQSLSFGEEVSLCTPTPVLNGSTLRAVRANIITFVFGASLALGLKQLSC
jgi:hypothetical protein